MSNNSIFDSVRSRGHAKRRAAKKISGLSCGAGDSAAMLAKLGYHVVATNYGAPPALAGDRRVGGVDLNACLPFRSASFDTVDLVEVIEHSENQREPTARSPACSNRTASC